MQLNIFLTRTSSSNERRDRGAGAGISARVGTTLRNGRSAIPVYAHDNVAR